MITVETCTNDEEFLREVRINGLLQYNMEKTGGKLREPDFDICYVARDGSGGVVGGVQGSTYLHALEVDVLWTHEAYRGQGLASRLLQKAERDAVEAGCVLSHLTTYSFQAPRFYEKQGYQVCGKIDGFPEGICLYVLKKHLGEGRKADDSVRE